MFDGSNRPPQPTIAEIQRAICERKGLTMAEIKAKCRKRRQAWPRQVGMRLCREMTDASYPKIARHFGNRDHTTVLWADRKIQRVAAQNPDLEILLNQLRERIMQMVADRPAPPPLLEPPAAPPPAPAIVKPRRNHWLHTYRPERPRLPLPHVSHVADIDAWNAMAEHAEAAQ